MKTEVQILDWYREGYEELADFWRTLDQLEAAAADFAESALDFVEAPLAAVLEQIRTFEPTVSVIGQVKAGKSTLLNALVGQVDLLPSDVNPWTSVITALHLNARHRPRDARAVFRFFDRDDWDRLIATGGRLGEMAARPGCEGEAEQVRDQVAAMRAATMARLGPRFDELLGGSHAFPTLEKSVIDRYICYGDPDAPAAGVEGGRYADLTKSADLYIDAPHLPKGLCLRDTPGVNDTFLMREQITLNAISDSRAGTVIVVLSAHQALTTMDVALLRIISASDAREVVIFVNRIDELEDPAADMPRIAAALRKTLRRLRIGEEIPILFGSGHWANCAIGDVTAMTPTSRAALARLDGGAPDDPPEALRRRVIAASGLPALLRTIARRVVDGPGQAMLSDVQSQLGTIIEMSESVDALAEAGATTDAVTDTVTGAATGAATGTGPHAPPITRAELSARLKTISDHAVAAFDARAAETRDHLRERLERVQENFTTAAVEALQSHIDSFGEIGAWTHDPTGLRMGMKTAFTAATARLRRHGEAAFDTIATETDTLLGEVFGVSRDSTKAEFPAQPHHRAPTVLARTLSLDLGGPWWRRFWRDGRPQAAGDRYRALIAAEIAPLIDEILTGFYDPAADLAHSAVRAFARDQGAFCAALLERMEEPGTEGGDTAGGGDAAAGQARRLSA